MKNVLKTLASQKEEVQKEFEQLQKMQAQLQQQLNEVVTRHVELRGKVQQIEQLEKEFQDEPKEE